MTEPTCAMRIYAGSPEQPPEFCDEEAMLDSDFCPAHAEQDEPDYDLIRDGYYEDLLEDF